MHVYSGAYVTIIRTDKLSHCFVHAYIDNCQSPWSVDSLFSLHSALFEIANFDLFVIHFYKMQIRENRLTESLQYSRGKSGATFEPAIVWIWKFRRISEPATTTFLRLTLISFVIKLVLMCSTNTIISYQSSSVWWTYWEVCCTRFLPEQFGKKLMGFCVRKKIRL